MSVTEAVGKIKAEMDGSQNNGYVKAVGDFLLQHLEANPDFAQHVLSKDKTIVKSMDTMRKIAEKNKVGNVAVLSDEQGFAIVVKYFGEEAPVSVTPSAPVKETTPKQAPLEPEKDAEEDDFDFDELLK